MNEFDYEKMLDQIKTETDPEAREELFSFIGEYGDNRFVEPLTELLKTNDSPSMRFSLYKTFMEIGTELANEMIEKKIRKSPPKDDGKKISKKQWEEAVVFLAESFEPSFISKVQRIIEAEGEKWTINRKREIGIYVRTLLRNNGFDWGEKALDDYWTWLLEDALKRIKKEGKKETK
ncbi:MAG: hypothetical protein GF308_12525 [Candidatus Heimdallarchaeota archaeon]|nr:hypothetical protein [Candidatus Heimdallarchaeota archaeon]